ncbi:GGDEF domain-containing protein [Desulfovibrio gilichinskyi]|nr:GGDEF domain-containing protein [Desulfovibrio gilichinskyi]
MFHTIVIEKQRLSDINQCLEDIRADALRIVSKQSSKQTSYETQRLSNLITKLKNIKKDNSFYQVINGNDANLTSLAEKLLQTSESQDTDTTQDISEIVNALDETVSSTLITIDKTFNSSLRNKIKIEYCLTVLVYVLIILQYFMADSYMRKRLIRQELEHQESKNIIKKLSERDTLTNLPGRKKFYEEADREIATATRYSSELTLIKMDIHDFKGINQKFGQQTGDKILARFSRMVRKNLRRPDSFFRVGGDKFVILAPHTTVENAENLASKINQLVKNDKTTSTIPLKINTGIATCVKGDSSEILMKKVATALNLSKKQGAGEVAVYKNSAD